MAKTTESRAKNFLFRELRPNVLIGMASDRYAGWIRQIYSEGRYEKGVTRRSHKVGDKTFNEETLPVESVTEYFEHFPLLGIDYTFYRLLLEKDAKPTQNFHFLKSYRQHMKDGDFVLLKAPQIVIARKQTPILYILEQRNGAHSLPLLSNQRSRLTLNGENDPATMQRADPLIAWQSDGNIRKLYSRYEDNPLVKWKDNIKRVVGLKVSTEPGMDR